MKGENGVELLEQCRHLVNGTEGFAILLYVLLGSSREEQRVGVGCMEEGTMGWGFGEWIQFPVEGKRVAEHLKLGTA